MKYGVWTGPKVYIWEAKCIRGISGDKRLCWRICYTGRIGRYISCRLWDVKGIYQGEWNWLVLRHHEYNETGRATGFTFNQIERHANQLLKWQTNFREGFLSFWRWYYISVKGEGNMVDLGRLPFCCAGRISFGKRPPAIVSQRVTLMGLSS